ncbi:hypothetical protein [Pontibacter brevis]
MKKTHLLEEIGRLKEGVEIQEEPIIEYILYSPMISLNILQSPPFQNKKQKAMAQTTT